MTTVSMDPRLAARRAEVLKMRGRRRLRKMAAVGAFALLAMALWWVVDRSPLLDVDAVAVEGASQTSAESVVLASGIIEGQPLVEVDTSQVKASVAALPWVDEVTANRSLNGTVKVGITERVPVAALPGVEGWLLVDPDGRVLEKTTRPDPSLVVIEGPSWQAEPGAWIGESALPAIEVASVLPAGLRHKVASVRPLEEGEIGHVELQLFGGASILLGDTANLDDKFLSALTMVVRANLDCVDQVDVRAPAVPVLTRIAQCS